jgi:predicted DNA-binding transcriptional regulator YafY
MIRRAIRDEEKLDIDYRDEQGRVTQRIIRPLALIYYLDAAVIVGWCEMRQAIRNFRLDRTRSCKETGLYFRNEGDALRNLWISGWKTQPAA